MSKAKYKEYKIWRFAYESCEDKILIPDNVKLYCVNYHRDDESRKCKITSEQLGKNIFNETYIAIIPYSDKVWNLSCDKRQTYNLNKFNVNNEYIVWVIEQIFPLSDDFPITTEIPVLPVSYLKNRTTRIEFNKKLFTKFIDDLETQNLSEEEKETKISDKFVPVYEYVKIHGIDKDYQGNLDITRVLVKSWLDGTDYFVIKRESVDIKEVLDERLDERMSYISEDEFNTVFNDTVNKLIN